uniref:Ribosomal protein S3 n=1 Tax=[Candida] norvegica TaxID=49330 RepID=S5U5F6_9ASCO|nr:ribosomal protein S3 [[Candida] norvegica]AGS44598.1 ribosomal protein S3 [[Candida] norvegica]
MLEIKRKEELLNNYLYKLSNKINKNNYENKNKIILKYIQEYNNKGRKLQNINKMNNWYTQLYKYNNNKLINILLIDNLVSKLLIKIFKINLNNIQSTIGITNIYINKPKFKHTINKLYIIFNYSINNNNNIINNSNNNNYYTSIINDINNILGSYNINKYNNNNNLSNYLSKIYNKEVIIIPNKIKYHYNDNIIFNKMIINNIEKYKGGLAGKYSKILRNNIPMNNHLLIKNNYINNIIKNNNIKYNNILNNNNNNINIIDIYNNININNIPNNLLTNKYLIGLNILYKGKNLNKAGISRSIKDKLLFGSLSNKLYSKYNGLLNSLQYNNILFNNNYNININKKYSLNYIPNHHSIINNNTDIATGRFKVNKVKTGVFGISTKLNTI